MDNCGLFFPTYSHRHVYMFTIDDGWHGENNSILVVDNRINWFVLYNWQVVSEVAVLQ